MLQENTIPWCRGKKQVCRFAILTWSRINALMHDRKESVILYSCPSMKICTDGNPQARFAGICKSERFPKEGDYVRPHLVIKLERIHSVLLSFFSPIFYFAVVSQVLMTFAIRSNSLYASYGLGSCSNRRTRTYERSACTLSIYLWPSCGPQQFSSAQKLVLSDLSRSSRTHGNIFWCSRHRFVLSDGESEAESEESFAHYLRMY